MVSGHYGAAGRPAARRVPAERSGVSAPAPLPRQRAPATTAPALVTTPARVTTTRVSVSGPAGRSSAPVRSPAAREAVEGADEGVRDYLEWQSVATETTPRRYLAMDQWCSAQVQVRWTANY